jgi:two-component system sensor histidine kinase FlrB
VLEEGQGEDVRERLVAIGEIAAEIAHELRNMLQVITANAFLARQNPAASAPALLKIERHARIANTIVDDLMALARGEAARAELTRVAEIVIAARSELAPNAATWDDSLTPIGLRARVHAGLATRLLHALYDNAVAASLPRVPRVTTRAYLDGDWAVIQVEDDGPGVCPTLAARIFDPLVTGRGDGTGLGLALARRIAAAHGGTITLAPSPSVADGAASPGACFEVRLPAR